MHNRSLNLACSNQEEWDIHVFFSHLRFLCERDLVLIQQWNKFTEVNTFLVSSQENDGILHSFDKIKISRVPL